MRSMALLLLTGPSGFVGSHTSPLLIEGGHDVRALVRDEAAHGRVAGRLTREQAARVTFATGDITRSATLPAALEGIDAVIHLVAIPRDRSNGAELLRVNTRGTIDLLAAMHAAGVDRVINLGAMGVADDPNLHFSRSKALAEAAVRTSGMRWTNLKPSLLWGERDGFFNIVASLVRMAPGVVPIPGGRRTRYQPLFVGDLARVVSACVERDDTIGRDFDLGGPEFWTYREIVEEVIRAMGSRRLILPLPVPLIKLVARSAEALHLPFPVASDQLRQLAFDNAAGLDDVEREFGFRPQSMRGQLGYLRRRRARQEASL